MFYFVDNRIGIVIKELQKKRMKKSLIFSLIIFLINIQRLLSTLYLLSLQTLQLVIYIV